MMPTPEEVLREVADEMGGLGFTDAVGKARANQLLCAVLNGADALAASQERVRELEGLMWQRCPVCDGRGDHMRGFYDGPGPTSSDGTTRVTCRTCNGLTVIRTVTPPRGPESPA